MLDIKRSICHGKITHALIKLDMGYQFDSVGTNIIVEYISGGMWIISKEDSFVDMSLQIEFYISRVLHIDTTCEGP